MELFGRSVIETDALSNMGIIEFGDLSSYSDTEPLGQYLLLQDVSVGDFLQINYDGKVRRLVVTHIDKERRTMVLGDAPEPPTE